jgi:predicted RNA-binding Zn ribbon-like protein
MPSASNSFRSHGFGVAAPWVDLANSAMLDGFGHLTDLLANPAWLHAFSRRWNFRPPPRKATPVRELRKLRALLRRLAEKAAGQGALHPNDFTTLNTWLKVPVFQRLVENQNGWELSLQPARSGWDFVLARVAASFGDTLIHQPRERLKICANPDCAWIFVDRTKGNVRRWCSDATCGNRDRVRRSRAAHKR